MRWAFYLIDRNNVRTRIEEPGGWDNFTLKIKRHAERHGTFREVQTNVFRFVGDAANMLKAEHTQYGSRGVYSLSINGKCNGSWTEVYNGSINFVTYKFTCADYCFVSVDVDQVGALVNFINRFDQSVDLSKSTAFDGAALTDYAGLSKTILLPSKTIKLLGRATNTDPQELVITGTAGYQQQMLRQSTTSYMAYGAIGLGFSTDEKNSITGFSPPYQMDYHTAVSIGDDVPEILLNDSDETVFTSGSYDIDFRVKGQYEVEIPGTGSGVHSLTLVMKKGTIGFLDATTVNLNTWSIVPQQAVAAMVQTFDIPFSGTVSLAPDELLWIDFYHKFYKTDRSITKTILTLDAETYVNIETDSNAPESTAKLTMINEAASRVTEAITNNQLKVYSEYYGRTDSEPYAMAANGCGSLRAIATGLDIRRAKLADGSDPKMFLSMKDVFESLAAIDNIGVGPEDDDKIRIEPWKFFYQDNVIFTCRNIQSIERATKADDLYSIFKTGYEKWESEDYNGLDEFLTKREYRTSLTNIQKTLEKVCKWIASGYAWEVTRRKTDDSKDWRYDNDTFIVCLTDYFKGAAAFTSATNSFNIIPGEDGIISIGDIIEVSSTASNNGTFTVTNVVQIANSIQVYVSGTFVSESAPAAVIRNTTTPIYRVEVKSITAATNILDPDTVYNYRISPARNAMRWFDFVAKCYKNIASADKLIFSAADGNYVASGLLDDVSGCAQEAAAIAENADISLDSFADPSEGTPVTEPERVVFKYGISFTEYNQITASPYGLIEFISPCERGQGWIDEIEYNPEDGTAKFTLIPKVQ